jgi:hypothetical protein
MFLVSSKLKIRINLSFIAKDIQAIEKISKVYPKNQILIGFFDAIIY